MIMTYDCKLARSMWESKVSRGQSSEATQSDTMWTKHESAITELQPFAINPKTGSVTELTTSGR